MSVESTSQPDPFASPTGKPVRQASGPPSHWSPGGPSPSTTLPVPPAPEVALALRGLVKVFGQTVAAAHIDLDIPVGAFYGMVGPNGAGKTTTLNMATGLLRPDRGTAFVRGVDVWADAQHAKQQLGVLPDGMRLFGRLRGRELITYAGLLRGLGRAEVAERADQLLRVFDLAKDEKTQVGDYSAGMTKKVSLACALVHSPSVLVLDEPFEAVDPLSAQGIREILTRFVAQGGTVVLSSHVMATVEQLCSHVAIMHRGQVVAAGTTAQVAAGGQLEDRFVELVGGSATREELAWLRPSSV
ncbi:ABC transporter ATP-binding protein [Buchananella hordeovulneris]|uniref:ABC transporter ATP-binding protein n=1 Tax=Buchananella hordeovulneris TaxID=52770 RepID=UPI000F5D53AA|nr:ABC transporter ATP-binding protein [Buchananella hordeovulneris]RRD53196.1 ABC transporter ATP-binding protein [Buchananella hordeovulneris]